MERIETNLKGCFIVKNALHGDERGFFLEGFNKRDFLDRAGINIDVRQINFAKSNKGVLSVVSGSVLDVVVDLRRESETFGKKTEIVLDSPDVSLFVPKGFAHGYEVLSDNTIFYYAVDGFYAPEFERGLLYNDPSLGINWGKGVKQISQKDKNNPVLEREEFIL